MGYDETKIIEPENKIKEWVIDWLSDWCGLFDYFGWHYNADDLLSQHAGMVFEEVQVRPKTTGKFNNQEELRLNLRACYEDMSLEQAAKFCGISPTLAAQFVGAPETAQGGVEHVGGQAAGGRFGSPFPRPCEFFDQNTLVYFAETNRAGLGEAAKAEWRYRWHLECPFWRGANGEILKGGR